MNMTDASPKFCSHCGAALRPGVRFCEQCGVAMAQELGHLPHVDSSVSGPNREGIEHLIGQAPCASMPLT
jgi:predicted amidophosphoribosyltransferase